MRFLYAAIFEFAGDYFAFGQAKLTLEALLAR
jgi:hypothetical protein